MAFNMQMREVTFVGIINILVLTGLLPTPLKIRKKYS